MYWNLTDKERLFQAFEIASGNRKLLERFFADIFTKKETEQFVIRLKIACLLHDGASYQYISSALRQSPTTIAKIAKKLDEKDSGYSKILEKFLSKGRGRAYFE
jgi:uncharacterized protein YerC